MAKLVVRLAAGALPLYLFVYQMKGLLKQLWRFSFCSMTLMQQLFVNILHVYTGVHTSSSLIPQVSYARFGEQFVHPHGAAGIV